MSDDRGACAPPAQGPVVGRVVAFDAERGLGTVAADDGRERPFHATAIADGSRRVDVGAAVTFVEVPGLLGRVEARDLTVLAAGRPVPRRG